MTDKQFSELGELIDNMRPVFDMVVKTAKNMFEDVKRDFTNEPTPTPTPTPKKNPVGLRDRYIRLSPEERDVLLKFHHKRYVGIERDAKKNEIPLKDHPQYIEYAESKAAHPVLIALREPMD